LGLFEVDGEGEGVETAGDGGVCDELSTDVALLVVDVAADGVPASQVALEPPNGPHSVLEQSVFLDHVYDIETYAAFALRSEGEIEPLVVAFGVSVVLQEQIVLLRLGFCCEIGVEEVSRLETRFEWRI
jgi:hypothetical protein